MATLSQRDFLTYYDRYSGDVYRLALSFLHDAFHAENVLQETFLSLYEHPPKTDNVKSYLLSICYRKAMDELRTQKKTVALDEEPVAEEQSSYPEVHAAVMGLKRAYQEPLVLHYWFDLSTREIAEALHLSEAAVRKRLERGRNDVKEALTHGR